MHRLWVEGDLFTAGLEAHGFISGSVTIPCGHAQIYPFVPPSQSGNKSIYWSLLIDLLPFQVCSRLTQPGTCFLVLGR